MSKATGRPVIRSADRLVDETRLVHQSRDDGLQWVIDNMALKEDITGLKGDASSIKSDVAALREIIKEGFATLGVNITNGDGRFRPVR
jgi:hypothetical protein